MTSAPKLLDIFACAVARDKGILAATLSTAVIVYGGALFSFSLSIDEEIALMHGVDAVFVSQGRWGVILLQRILLPAQFTPFFTALLTLILLCASAWLISLALKLSDSERLLFCPLYVAFPQFAYQLVFSQQSDSVALGLLCASGSFWSFTTAVCRKKKARFFYTLLCIVLGSLATGVYQALFFVPPTLYVLDAYMRAMRSQPNAKAEGVKYADYFQSLRNELRRASLFAVIWVLVFLVYSGISKAFSFCCAIPLSGYLFTHVGWFSQDLPAVLKQMTTTLAHHLTGRAYYGEAFYALMLLFLPFVTIYTWKKNSIPPRGWLLFVFIATLFAPFVQILCLGKEQAARTLLGQAIVFAAIAALALQRLSLHKVLTTSFIVMYIFIACAHTSRLFFENKQRFEADTLLANRIISRIYAANSDFSEKSVMVYIHGAPEYTPPRHAPADAFGSSFFCHDGGNIYRTQAFFKVTGIADITPPSQTEIMAIMPYVKALPVWPAAGSVAMTRGIMVVKLGQDIGYIEDVPYLRNNF